MYSLKTQLTVRVLILFFLCWLATIYVALFGSVDFFYEDIELELNDSADFLEKRLVLVGVDNFVALQKTEYELTGEQPYYMDALQIWCGDKLAYSSAPFIPAFLPEHGGFHSELPGRIDRETRWIALRRDVPALNCSLVIWRDTDLDDELSGLLWDVFSPVLIVLPLACLALFWVIGKALKPLTQLQHTIGQRTPDNLSAITIDHLPDEIHAVVTAINALFARIQLLLHEQNQALEKERLFTANAAHELLTPLAAIKTEVQLFAKQHTNNDSARSSSLMEISSRVDRATQTVEQLITLARIDPLGDVGSQFESVNLSTIFENTAASLGGDIEEKNIQFSYESTGDVVISGLPTPLGILCHNLLGNAIKYCPAGGRVSCHTENTAGAVKLVISNDGKPIPEYLKDRIFDRFVRGAGEVEPGSGLGLAIVQQVVQLHQASISLVEKTPGNGTVVEVVFKK